MESKIEINMTRETIESHLLMGGHGSQEAVVVPNKKMQKGKSKLKGIVRLKGFTLLELLIVMSIIVLHEEMSSYSPSLAEKAALDTRK
ncbi:MAG: prepilin-type N-terminal cleavage/methylation domain-containing protein, partial [Planctomycetota bacterium]